MTRGWIRPRHLVYSAEVDWNTNFRPASSRESEHISLQLHENGESPDHESFKASTGWLNKFKNQHSIRNLSIQGEKLSAAEETVEPVLGKAEQIYNADETGLLWKCLLQRTLVSCREKSAPGFKKAKDRLSVQG